MSKVKRVYVEKKQPFAVTAKELTEDIKGYLEIDALKDVRVLVRYDVENISDETYNRALTSVFSEPPVDNVYEETFPYDADNSKVFSVEFLPGQFDQRADSAVQCVKFLNEDEEPVIKTATTYVLEGNISDEEFEQIKNYCINPVDSRETGLEKPETLVTEFEEPADVIIFDGFKDMAEEPLKELYDSLGLAMTFKDFLHIQNYYKNEENRDPSMTEIRVLDTYWSDHCRHTTFNTELTDVTFDDGYFKEPIEKSYQEYLDTRKDVFGERKDKFVCLMDLALIAMRKLKKEGKLDDQEKSDEINACSIVVPVEVDGKTEEWLVNFKNETHNHPTEIEPFGGAATCLGGAIRDPLSGRAYVYQSMRITGAGDPRKTLAETTPGKLPQRKICQEAAHGFSSYGNQIGLTTGYVHEIYDEGYIAKRMEVGAVVAAAPKEQVKRLEPQNGQIVLLIGGRTGRDGIGGATGSSKSHDVKSIETAGAEVQKGNPVEERKIQRLFRNKAVSEKVVRCNDFGAGGVCVAVGELAPGLDIDLDAVLKKYDGLTGTELAISESQERMAIVVNDYDVDFIKEECAKENLEVVQVATVTDTNRLVMKHMGKDIVNISRDFLDAAGAKRYQNIEVELPNFESTPFDEEERNDFVGTTKEVLSRLSVASQKGLVERFDSSIGNGTVLSPYGGRTYHTETEGMAALIPVLGKETTTASLMAYGYNPKISKWSPYHGAMYAVVESVAKIVAMGGNYHTIRFSFQEYFEKLLDDPKRWWEVIDRTTGEIVPTDKWEFDEATGEVEIQTKAYHEYTVSFLAFLIWDPVHMYNFITNDWQDTPHQLTYDVRQPKTQKYVKEKLKRWCEENPNIDVVRFTTFFHQFTLTFDDQKREKYVEWFGYSASVSPYILEKFEKWAGYKFRPEFIVDQGYHNSMFRVPSKEFRDFIEFQQIEVCALAKELVDIVHSYGKEAMMFLGDHWIGTEPYGKYFAGIGLDAVVGSVGSGVTLRMISDIKGVDYTEGRLLPYFFPDVFCEGGDPIGEARDNWRKARRALLRSPLDRIGYGGYLKLASNWPGFIDEIQKVVTEFRQIHENMQGTPSYVAPFKVAILNCWGGLRKWMSNQVHHAIWHRETYSAEGVLECLSGMPFEVEFISFDDVKKGIPEDIGVIINVGDAYTAFSGAENWIDEEVVTNIRRFVDEGGGFIGVGEPTAYQHQGRFFQLSDVLGVDREMCFSLNTDKYNELDANHFILEDIEGKIDFGEGTSRVYAQGKNYQILAMDGEYSQMVVNEYGKGHSVYFAGLPYSPQNCRILLRAIYYAAGMEKEMKHYYVTNVDTEVTVFPKSKKIAVINNSSEARHTDVYINGNCVYELDLEPGEMRWVDDVE